MASVILIQSEYDRFWPQWPTLLQLTQRSLDNFNAHLSNSVICGKDSCIYLLFPPATFSAFFLVWLCCGRLHDWLYFGMKFMKFVNIRLYVATHIEKEDNELLDVIFCFQIQTILAAVSFFAMNRKLCWGKI